MVNWTFPAALTAGITGFAGLPLWARQRMVCLLWMSQTRTVSSCDPDSRSVPSIDTETQETMFLQETTRSHVTTRESGDHWPWKRNHTDVTTKHNFWNFNDLEQLQNAHGNTGICVTRVTKCHRSHDSILNKWSNHVRPITHLQTLPLFLESHDFTDTWERV